MKIAIIGAGPIGCYAGYLLAKSGHNVSIYERKKEIGLPIQCTGLLTADFDQFGFDKSSFLVNTFSEIEVNSSNKKLVFSGKEYLVCRKKFDNYLANLALKAGAKIFFGSSFLRREKEDIVVAGGETGQEKIISPEIVIAADGPLSNVAKSYGFYLDKRKNYYGIQAVVRGNFNPQRYRTYFGKETCPDLFAWIVPESKDIARVGLATTKNPRFYFDKFMLGKNFSVMEMQAGTIPLYHPKQKMVRDNCYLLGDASGYVKATTLGGIIPGMKQAQVLVDCIDNGKDYEVELGTLRKRMNLHLRLRKVMNKFSDKDWDSVLKLLGQEKVRKVFEEHTRENPLPLVMKTLFREPRFLKFVKYLF
ncbi:NAD(P)/FAD-dependent oxidoreductase [Candidatus Woesearchaeota archaeon]|jgi:digeranylgeranylglycerophospholipid reductase|nr:NAD(P)/FAD-dependent oxidoreductase [Candidatus Woesearchaeota archaeon]MBT5342448.1 NAD(P)/FAD-dependent oxidoreductase [Candidatus Woesearchaeota archaeon]